jgi:hypothetical protein
LSKRDVGSLPRLLQYCTSSGLWCCSPSLERCPRASLVLTLVAAAAMSHSSVAKRKHPPPPATREDSSPKRTRTSAPPDHLALVELESQVHDLGAKVFAFRQKGLPFFARLSQERLQSNPGQLASSFRLLWNISIASSVIQCHGISRRRHLCSAFFMIITCNGSSCEQYSIPCSCIPSYFPIRMSKFVLHLWRQIECFLRV